MEREVAIVAAGQTAFMRRSGATIGELCFSAYREAVRANPALPAGRVSYHFVKA